MRDGDDDLRGQPLAARRLRLQERVRPRASAARLVRLSEMVADDGRAMLARARADGWEGLIAKDGRSLYHSGRRTPAWRKLKLLKQQEFVVGGWTDPRQTRPHFGALLLGYFERGLLHFAGSVGTGFDEKELDRVAKILRKLAAPAKPFAGAVSVAEKPHWVTARARRARSGSRSGRTKASCRQPVYLGVRQDKKARDVRKERSVSEPGDGEVRVN